MQRFSQLIAFVALLLTVSSLRAATIAVDYYTTGSFSGAATKAGETTAFSSNTTSSSVTVKNTTSGLTGTLTFNFDGSSGSPVDINVPLPGIETGLDLGDFTFASTDGGAPVQFAGVNFSLDIYQTLPGGGPGILSAIVTGGLNSTATSLQVEYNVYSVIIQSTPKIQYTITDIDPLNGKPGEDISLPIAGHEEIGAEAGVAVPLSNTASMTLVLLVGLSGLAAIRRLGRIKVAGDI